MEFTTVYVLVVKGVKHYYTSEIDRNYGFNTLTRCGTIRDFSEYEFDIRNVDPSENNVK